MNDPRRREALSSLLARPRAAGAPDAQKFSAVEEITTFLERLDFQPVLVNSIYQPTPEPAPQRDAPIPPTVRAGRLDACDALALLDESPFWDLGQLANEKRIKMNDPSTATFVIDRNISVTNVCLTGCRFCAFHVEAGDERAFILSVDEIAEKVTHAAAAGATQVLLQGGLNPQTDLAYYEKVFLTIKQLNLPDICVHSLSPTEIDYLAELAGLTVEKVLERLRTAGLDSLPGAGLACSRRAPQDRGSTRRVCMRRTGPRPRRAR